VCREQRISAILLRHIEKRRRNGIQIISRRVTKKSAHRRNSSISRLPKKSSRMMKKERNSIKVKIPWIQSRDDINRASILSKNFITSMAPPSNLNSILIKYMANHLVIGQLLFPNFNSRCFAFNRDSIFTLS